LFAGNFVSAQISVYNSIFFDGNKVLTEGHASYYGRTTVNPIKIGFLNG
jgi:hypothetical protein